MRARGLLAASMAMLAIVAAAEQPAPEASSKGNGLRGEVRAVEQAFAATMAARDLDAFAGFLADEAVFIGGQRTLNGRKEIVEGWRPYFEGARAPFSWAPERVEVVASGTLALSTGPVFDPEGKRIGTYTSTWRREPDGSWRIVLDGGCPPCRCTEGHAQ